VDADANRERSKVAPRKTKSYPPRVVLLATARQLATPGFASRRSPAGETKILTMGGETWRKPK